MLQVNTCLYKYKSTILNFYFYSVPTQACLIILVTPVWLFLLLTFRFFNNLLHKWTKHNNINVIFSINNVYIIISIILIIFKEYFPVTEKNLRILIYIYILVIIFFICYNLMVCVNNLFCFLIFNSYYFL